MIRLTAAHEAASGGLVRRALAGVAAVLMVAWWVAPTAARAESPALPDDPAAHGYVGLCDEHGNNVSGGSIDAAPFIWKAVASQPPPASYRGKGANAVLNIYQPRPDTDPLDWSGDSLTAATFYSTPSQPTVQATYADGSLSDFMHEFPPLVDGLYQLRIYFGKVDYGLYNATYPASTIQVVGTTWRVVDGGTVDCGAAHGVSNEALTHTVPKADTVAHQNVPAHERLATRTRPGPIASTPSTASAGGGRHRGDGRPGSGAGSTRAGAAGNGGADVAPAAKVASLPQRSSSTDEVLWIVLPAGAVLLLAGGVLIGRRRGTWPETG